MRMQKTYIALALAGALTAATATPSLADGRWGWAAGGFAAGALVGAAAANANAGYYGPGYAYAPSYYYTTPGYASYGYAPGYAAYTPGYASYGYAPGYTAYNYAPRYTTGYATYGYSLYYSYRPNRAPVFDPENGDDPDPRIGGSYKMNSSGSD